MITCLLFVSNVFAAQQTITWEEPTTYVDGDPIGAEQKPIVYDFTRRTQGGTDNVMVVSGATGTSAIFEQAADGKTYIFNGRARLVDGAQSDWCPDYLWTAPTQVIPGVPMKPINIGPIRRP